MSDQKRQDKIREALGKLNPESAALWTEDGLPTLDAVKDRTGFEVTRDEVTAAAPKFTRETRDASPPAPKAEDPAPKDQEPPKEEPPAQEVSTEASREAADERVEAAAKAVEDARAARDKLSDQILQLEKAHQAAVAERDRLFPPPNQAQATQAWIQSQQAARAARHGRVSALMEATGGRPQDVLDPRTPVERAMARPNGHGHGRPNYTPQAPKG